MAKQVVILGAGFAGVGVAHKLLKYTTPKVRGLKVILVAPTTHHFWNLAAVRGVIPGEISDETIFHPIQPGFAKYSAEQFEFILGTATALDTTGNSVSVETAQGTRSVVYDQLVIATGTSTISGLPFKSLSSYEETISKWHDLQAQVKAAKSIVVAGGGSTGVETIGELGSKYGREKQITLVVAGDRVLPDLLPGVSKAAEKTLTKLGVNLIHNAKATGVNDKKITLSNGKTLTADLYLPLFGVRVNNSFIPSHLLDAQGSLRLENTLRVTGLSNVWGVGDVGNLENKQAAKAEPQVIHLAQNLDAVLGGTDGAVKDYKPSDKPMIFVTIGKKTGTGQMGNFKVFGWLVAMAKGKTFFTEKAAGLVSGKNILSAAV